MEVINEFGRAWTKAVVTLSSVGLLLVYRSLLGGTEDTHDYTQYSWCPAMIRSWNLRKVNA
jgi:hypothetical protein